jgi:hypothetical protein
MADGICESRGSRRRQLQPKSNAPGERMQCIIQLRNNSIPAGQKCGVRIDDDGRKEYRTCPMVPGKEFGMERQI